MACHRWKKGLYNGTTMKKDSKDLPPEVQAQIRALEALPEGQIDTNDSW